jgi:hypothetical protein
MKKVILLAAGALALASVTAYAQMNHRHAPAQSDHSTMQGHMHSQMQGHMHGHANHAQLHDQMHGKMKGTPPSQQQGSDAGDGSDAGHAAHGAQGAADGPRGDRGPQARRFKPSMKRCTKA